MELVFVDTIGSVNYLVDSTQRFARDVRSFYLLVRFDSLPERVWRNGSASASQAEGCGFESRRPLHFSSVNTKLKVQKLVKC